MRRIAQRLAAYTHSDDPIAAASNLIAVIVAINLPFWPLSIHWLVGNDHGASYVTFFSTPFFLAVLAIMRLSSLAGRAMLPLVGILNTLASAQALGAASGVDLFLCPCAGAFERPPRAAIERADIDCALSGSCQRFAPRAA